MFVLFASRLSEKIVSQVRSRETLHDKLLQAGKDNVDGVLLLSGSHPANKLAAYFGYSSNQCCSLACSTRKEQHLECAKSSI